jgi:hypothetical protein
LIMAFNSVEGLVTYTASAGQTDFGFAFKIYANTDVSVYVDGVKKTIVDDYSATVNGDNGGTITFNSGLAANAEVMLVRELPITRDTEYQLNGDLSSAALNRDQNYQTYLAMDVKVKAGLVLTRANAYTDQEAAILQGNIDAETAARVSGDDALSTRVNAAQADADAAIQAVQNIEASGTIRQTSEEFTATTGQTVFTLTTTTFAGEDTLAVYVNGVRQSHSAYTTSSTNVITFSEGLQEGDKVLFTVNESTSTTLTASQVSYQKNGNTDVDGALDNVYETLATLTVDTINDLPSDITSKEAVVVSDENHGGTFIWEANVAKTEHNGGTIIDPDVDMTTWTYTSANAGNGVWRRQYDGSVSVKWFGAKGDGVSDDTLAIQSTIDFLSSEGGVVTGKSQQFVIDSLNGLKVNSDNTFLKDFDFIRTDPYNTGYTLSFATTNDVEGGGVIDCTFVGINTLAACAGLRMGSATHKANKYILSNIEAREHGQYGVAIEAGDYWKIDNIRVIDHGLTTGSISSCIGFYIYPKLASTGGQVTNVYSRMSDAARDNSGTNSAAIKIQTHQNLIASNITGIYGREEALSIDSPSGLLTNFIVIAQVGRPAVIFGNSNTAHSFSGQTYTADGFDIRSGISYLGASTDTEYKLTGCTLRNLKSDSTFDSLNRTNFKDCVFENWYFKDIQLGAEVTGLPPSALLPTNNVLKGLVAYTGRVAVDTSDSLIIGCGSTPKDGETTNTLRVNGDNNLIKDCFNIDSASNGMQVSGDSNTITNPTIQNPTGRSIWISSGSDNVIYSNDLSQGSRLLDSGTNTLYSGRTRKYEGVAAPLTGTWNAGDIIYDITPSASGHIGWVCVTAGTPGTWKTFGTISA